MQPVRHSQCKSLNAVPNLGTAKVSFAPGSIPPTHATQTVWILILLLWALSCGISAAQSSDTGAGATQTLHVTSRLLVLDAVVTDRKGAIVRTLGRDDLLIFEDGVLQRTLTFEPPSSHDLQASTGPVVTSAADLKKIGQSPVTILVIDELNTKFEDEAYARNQIAKYLRTQPPVLRQPTELLLVGNTKFRMLHDFSQRRDELVDAIRQHVPDVPFKSQQRGGAMSVELLAQSMSAMIQAAQASTGKPGRKNLIWVGKGFSSVNTINLDDRTTATLEAAVKRVTAELLAARVTLYLIDPTINESATVGPVQNDDGGLEGPDFVNANPFADAVSLPALTVVTGGNFFYSRNDVDAEISNAIDRGAEYYTLSYSPTNKSDLATQFRSIRVVAKDKSLKVTSRSGYYAAATNPTESNLPADDAKQGRALLQMELSRAALSTMAYNGLNVKAVPNGDHAWTLMIGASELKWKVATTGESMAEVSAVAAAFDGKGKVIAHQARELAETTATDHPESESSAVRFNLPFDVPRGAVRLRFVLRDPLSGKIGTADVGLKSSDRDTRP